MLSARYQRYDSSRAKKPLRTVHHCHCVINSRNIGLSFKYMCQKKEKGTLYYYCKANCLFFSDFFFGLLELAVYAAMWQSVSVSSVIRAQ